MQPTNDTFYCFLVSAQFTKPFLIWSTNIKKYAMTRISNTGSLEFKGADYTQQPTPMQCSPKLLTGMRLRDKRYLAIPIEGTPINNHTN